MGHQQDSTVCFAVIQGKVRTPKYVSNGYQLANAIAELGISNYLQLYFPRAQETFLTPQHFCKCGTAS